MGKKSKGSCKSSNCCKEEDVKLERMVLPRVRTSRVPVSAGDNSMADTHKALITEIKSLVEQGIQSVTSDVPKEHRQSLTFSTSHTIEDTGDAKLLTVTIVGMWMGVPATNSNKPEETKNERRTAAPKSGEAVPGSCLLYTSDAADEL